MSNANRDYAIVYDVKNSLLVLSRPLNFYLTDKNTSNIFVKLVTRVIVGDGLDQYTDIENASSYVLTMRVIKPDDEVKSIIATQHESESIFQFDLTEDFKDIPGKYICELTISNIVNGRQEFTTSDPFNYEVKRSILSNVKNIIEGKDTTVEKLLNNLDATKAELSSQIKEKAENIQTQINNLVLGAVGDGNNAEVVQSRGKFKLLNDRLDAMSESIGFTDKEIILPTLPIRSRKKWAPVDGGGVEIVSTNETNVGIYPQAVPHLLGVEPGEKIYICGLSAGDTYFLDDSYKIIDSVWNLKESIGFQDISGEVTFTCPGNAKYIAATIYSDITNMFFGKDRYTSSKINELKNNNYDKYKDLSYTPILGYTRYTYVDGKIKREKHNTLYDGKHCLTFDIVEIKGKSYIETIGLSVTASYILDENMQPISIYGIRDSNGNLMFDFEDKNKKTSFVCPENAKYLALTFFSDNTELYIREWDGNFFHNNRLNLLNNLSKESNNLKEELNNLKAKTDSNGNLKLNEKYRYMMTSFNYDDMHLCLLGTNDGVNFEVINDNAYTPSLGRGTLRDPSITQLGDYYYITYTVIDVSSGNGIGMCRTKDFNDFEELPQLTAGEFDYVWAPEFFIDGFDAYIVFSGSIYPEGFQAYYTKYDYKTHSVGEILKLNIINQNNVIDTSLLRKNGKYYAFCKNETTKYLFVACANSLDGEFTVIHDDSQNSKFGHPVEGQMCIRLDNGKIRLYYEDITTPGKGGFYYSDTISDTIESGWTDRKKVNINSSYNHSHPFVIDLHKGNCTDI